MEVLSDGMERAALTEDLSSARRDLQQSVERLRESLCVPAETCRDTGETEEEEAAHPVRILFA